MDRDRDGVWDCHDGCPEDPDKTKPGVCGCNQPEGTCVVADGVIPVREADFSVGFIPDVQRLTSKKWWPRLKDVMQFYADHREDLNLRAVVSVGDMVAHARYPEDRPLWEYLESALAPLRAAGIPFVPTCGNHDGCGQKGYYGDPRFINEYFPYNTQPPAIFGGTYQGGVENAYYTISHNNRNFLLLTTEYADATVDAEWQRINKIWSDWAVGVLDAHRDHHALFVSHSINDIQTPLVCGQQSIFMAVQGHAHGGLHRRDPCGTKSAKDTFTFAFQHETDTQISEGAVARYYTFKTEDNQVCMRTYSTHRKSHLADSQCGHREGVCHEYCWEHDMRQ